MEKNRQPVIMFADKEREGFLFTYKIVKEEAWN